MDASGISILGLGLDHVFALLIIMAASGFVSGLSGFGFSAIGAATLWILPPQQAIPLLMALSTANQIASMKELRASIGHLREWQPLGAIPYIFGGLFGLPVGLWILRTLPPASLCAAVGTVLIAYSAWALFKPSGLRVRPAGVKTSIAVGMMGGVVGGFTAFPGSAVVVYAGLAGMPKEQQRSIVQPFILTMQLVALAMLALSGNKTATSFGVQFWILFVCLTPVVLPFTRMGVDLFRNISDIDFKRVTNMLLCVSGVGLALKGTTAIVAMTEWLQMTAETLF